MEKPKEFNPETDPFPESPDIPAVLEFKLDVMIWELHRANQIGLRQRQNKWLWLLTLLIALGAIMALLAAILAELQQVNLNLLGVIAAITALEATMVLLAFMLCRKVVTDFKKLYY